MRKFLLLPLVLLLAACDPVPHHETLELETSGGVVALNLDLAEVTRAVEDITLPGWPYFSTWQTCIINGETYTNVTFMYTDLGLGYMVDNILYYRLTMEVTECQTVMLDIDDIKKSEEITNASR